MKCLISCKKMAILCVMMVLSVVNAVENEILPLKIVSYDLFTEKDPETLKTLCKALYEEGIVGIRGVPGYQEKTNQFILQARQFCALPEEIKEKYAPNREKGDLFLGYEKGKEKFKREDGSWVVDDLKVSYYAFIPEHQDNYWPMEVDLQRAFLDLGMLMSQTGKEVMQAIDLIGPATDVFLGQVPQVGRMLCYQKTQDTYENPYWCGSHFDHGLFTVITPAFYFTEQGRVEEPKEAGLFVKVNGVFKKVVADSEVMLFQVGEFGQLVMDDAIRATEHRVHKAKDLVERYAMALFFDVPMETVIHSFSELTKDPRYGGSAGEACSYKRWHEESFKRYLVKESKP